MKKKIRILFALIICALMVHTGITATAVSAAVKTNGTIDLKAKKLIIPNGKKTAIKGNKITIVRGCKYQVKTKFGKPKWKSTKPSVVTTSKAGVITAKKPGTATLKITYKNKNQSLKIKVVASHKHSFKITKKATCKAKGVQTCSVCGVKNALPKTAHHYVTKTNTHIEGRGKKTKYETSMLCPNCRWDMTDWTIDQQAAHQSHIEAMAAGIISEDCFSAGSYTGVAGAIRYEKRVKVQTTETYCENCGTWDMDKTYEKDLYYVNAKGEKIGANEDPYAVWSYENYCKEHGFVLCENCHLEVMPGHECHRCHIVAPTTTSTASVRKAVANAQDTLDAVDNGDVTGTDTAEIATEIVSENAIISDNN